MKWCLKRMHEDILFNSDFYMPLRGPCWPQQCLPSSGGQAHLQGVDGSTRTDSLVALEVHSTELKPATCLCPYSKLEMVRLFRNSVRQNLAHPLQISD